MIELVSSEAGLLVALLLFGFMPGAALRVVVLAFSRDDPRRSELPAELHAVPRWERPFWVMEQIELAICEGLWGRFVWALTGRVIRRWRLMSGVKSHAKYPDTFHIPSEVERARIGPGMLVKLGFAMRRGGERMWVEVTDVSGRRLVGRLVNTPIDIPRLQPGDEVKFTSDHVLDIVENPHPELKTDEAWGAASICPCCATERNDCDGGASP